MVSIRTGELCGEAKPRQRGELFLRVSRSLKSHRPPNTTRRHSASRLNQSPITMASPNDDMLRTLREDIRNMNSNLQPEESVRGGIYRSQWTPSKTHMVPVWRQRPQDIQPEYPEPMRLNVGGRKFEVGRATLTESGYFRSLLSNKHSWSAQPDGSYFVDADPEIFEYLIRFMRRPSVYPLFWSKNDGFDYGLYHRVQVEAEHFEMPSLYEWIKNKTYVDAISVHTLKPVNEFVNTMGEKEKPGNYSEDCQVVS